MNMNQEIIPKSIPRFLKLHDPASTRTYLFQVVRWKIHLLKFFSATGSGTSAQVLSAELVVDASITVEVGQQWIQRICFGIQKGR